MVDYLFSGIIGWEGWALHYLGFVVFYLLGRKWGVSYRSTEVPL